MARPTLEAARDLIGCRLIADDAIGGRIAGRIVEVEAYIGEADRASHARFGRTSRNWTMYGDPGHAYLYLVYGMYTCLNVVTEPAGQPAAVLIRAVEVTDGIEAARHLRLTGEASVKRARDDPLLRARIAARVAALPADRLASGPGLVGAAFGLGVTLTGLDLCAPGSPVRLEPARAEDPVPTIVATPRIGIGYAGEPWLSQPWRFAIAGHPSVSGPRPTP
ncbi:MAG: DNA-3-methyladenine glycosylase [Candidatus Limnocylindrales bacterium]